MMNTMKRVVAGAGLLVGLSATAQAQYLTDAGSPLGGGGGAVGGVVNYGGIALSPTMEARAFTPNGMVIVGAPTVALLVTVMNSGGAGNVSALATSFGGGAAGQALAEAFGAFGGMTPTAANARAALIAYNAAIDANSGPVPEALVLARAVLIGFGAKSQ